MSMWLSSYSGYFGTDAVIVPQDSEAEQMHKVQHMLLHLSMTVFQNMDFDTRYRFLQDAMKQFKKVTQLEFQFSLEQLFALPFIPDNNRKKYSIEEYYHLSKAALEKHKEIHDQIEQYKLEIDTIKQGGNEGQQI